MASYFAHGWAIPLFQAVKTEFRRITRAGKGISIFLIAVLSCLAVGQAGVPRPNSLKLKPCGQWTDTDFLTAVVADVAKDSEGQEFLAAFNATFPIPEGASKEPAEFIRRMQDRYPNCCYVKPRKFDDWVLRIVEPIVSPGEKTVIIETEPRPDTPSNWHFAAIYDIDRCGAFLDTSVSFQH